ncbi:MAG TPA: universal stress protein [Verrucomicrobiales bacterium]|nr:universal stress protein [Verrucomicrobiales bacterium]
MKIEHILVPIDFSEGSESALCCALEMAEKFGSSLILFHVLTPLPAPVSDEGLPDTTSTDAFRQSAQKELDNLAQLIGTRIKVRTKVAAGVAWNEIVQFAKDDHASLIIMSTHGRTGIRHAFLGSVAERVVRHAGCPVLVVRENEPLKLKAA